MMQDLLTIEKEVEILHATSLQGIYQKITLDCASRLLSLLDRNPYSKTYGSFSRNYWHYKTLVDFPSASDQQGILALASICMLNLKENKFYLNSNILELIEASINFWGKIQNKDGSFNEWYPNEHSYVATAFTSYAISETLLLLKDKISTKTQTNAIHSLRKSGKWLTQNIDTVVLNHTCGAISALYNIHLLTGEKIFQEGLQKNINTLLDLQNSEGWYPEYGLCDPGYLGVSIDYLAKYWIKSKDSQIETSIKKALDFLIWFYQEEINTTGGEFGGRNVKYMLPHGLLLLSERFETARYLEANLRAALTKNKTITPETVDDRYFLFFHYPNYAQSVLKELSKGSNHKRQENFLRVFSNAGLVSYKQKDCHFIVNLKKGGVSSFSSKELKLSDSGYFVKMSNTVLTSQTSSEVLEITNKENLQAKIKTNFVEFNSSEPILKWLLTPFRLFNYTFGKSSMVMRLFNRFIKKRYVQQTKKSNLNLSLERLINIDSSKVIIEDKITGNINLEKLAIEPHISLMHVPTSKYFHFSELDKDESFNPDDLEKIFNKEKKIRVKRVIDLSQNCPKVFVEVS